MQKINETATNSLVDSRHNEQEVNFSKHHGQIVHWILCPVLTNTKANRAQQCCYLSVTVSTANERFGLMLSLVKVNCLMEKGHWHQYTCIHLKVVWHISIQQQLQQQLTNKRGQQAIYHMTELWSLGLIGRPAYEWEPGNSMYSEQTATQCACTQLLYHPTRASQRGVNLYDNMSKLHLLYAMASYCFVCIDAPQSNYLDIRKSRLLWLTTINYKIQDEKLMQTDVRSIKH